MTTSEPDCVYCWTTAKRRRVSVSYNRIIFLVFAMISCTHCDIPYRECVNTNTGQFEACVPSSEKIFQNINTTVTVEPSNATCGLTEENQYLKLGDTGQVFRCQVGQHAKDRMIDANMTSWWQSKTWSIEEYDATQPNHQYAVTLTFSITKTYRMKENITLTFNSGRPQKMVIEKSSDYGGTWVPLQYYARDCDREYPNAPRSFANNLTAVICTEDYSQDTNNPQPGRKVFFPGSNERIKSSSLDNYYRGMAKPEMQQFLTFTNIRVRLLYPATDAKEFSRQRQDFYRYYYAIYEIDVTGSCFCNMHGSGCMSNLNGESVCDCSHNTEGKDCEKCKPLYNNKPWKEGSYEPIRIGTANACEKCECYDHADSCTYDSTLGSGVCDNCKHNTTGVKCDECLDTFYPNITALLNDTNVCKDCDCEILGLMDTNNTSCQKNRALPDIGQCTCKSRVTGRRCDRCEDEYYGLLDPGSPGTCKECRCNRYGTDAQSNVCDYTTGQCPCKASTDGRLCDKCKEGFFQFPAIPSDECRRCGCDSGGSTTFVCEVQFGMCTCIPHVLGPKCTQMERLFYIPALDEFIKQPESGDCPIESDLWTASKPFDGDVFATCPPTSSVTVNFEPILGTQEQFEVAWPYIVSVRYALSELIVRTGGEVIVTVTGNSNVDVSRYVTNGQAPTTTCPVTFNTEYNVPVNFTNGEWIATTGEPHVTLDKRCSYSLKLILPAEINATIPIFIDSVVLLPSLSNPDTGKEFRTLNESSDRAANYQQCIRKLASLSTRLSAMESSPCKELLWSAAAELYKEGKQCQCNLIGTVGDTCNPHGGQCTCKPGVGGRRCDSCLPGYYNLTSTGCTACECATNGSLNGACNATTGQCQCRLNVAVNGQTDAQGNANDRQCRACIAGFYGYGSEGGCTSCTCNPDGSNGTQCTPDGQCPCKPTIGGQQCDRCADSYFSFSASGCQSCSCDPRGSTDVTCESTSGACSCKQNVAGEKCDTCKTGFYNLADYNPRGCQPCFCFGHGSTCTSAGNFKDSNITTSSTETWDNVGGYREATSDYLGNKISSYGRMLNFELSLTGSEGNMSQVALVTMEGDGTRMVYKHSEQTVGGQNMISVRLFPENWILDDTTNPSPEKMYRVLANMTRLAFNTLLNGIQNNVSSVTMESAEAADGFTAQTGSVENCTCSDFVAGLSCESCRTGLRRSNPQVADTRYDTCTPCSCSGRTYDPMECDEMTGVCLNCKNGTAGDNCGDCAPNVIGQSCDTCNDNFWDLGAYGCRECNCTAPGSTSGTVCDKKSGQCVCAAHVTGRQCDVCEDNHHNLTAAGCSVCDGCYTLVKEEADKLRTLLVNLTDVIATLKTNDDTVRLGGFVDRINNATTSLNKLLVFLKTANDEEASVQNVINQVNTSIIDLTAQLDELVGVNIPLIDQQLQDTDTNLKDSVNTRQTTINNMMSINSTLGPLNQISSTLDSLVTSLKSVESYLGSLTSNSSSQVDDILSTVTLIEDTAKIAINRTQADQEASQALFEKHKNTTKSIAELEKKYLTLESLANSSLTEAKMIGAKSNATYNTANRLETDANVIGTLDTPFLLINNTLISLRNRLSDNRTTAVTGTTEVEAKKAIVDEAIRNSQQQQVNTSLIIEQCNELNDRLSTAERKAEDAELLSNKTFQDAETMKDTMLNFIDKAREVELKANTSLESVQKVTDDSEKVIADAAALTASLTLSQQSASSALAKASQAKNTAQDKNTGIANVAASAENLRRNLTSDLSDLEQKASVPSSINTTTVVPAQQKCQSLQSDVLATNDIITTADTKAETAKTNVQLTQVEASRVLVEISNLTNLDVARIESLKDEVGNLTGLFNEQQLISTITALKNDYELQRDWLDELKIKKANLERKIASIKLAQQRITYGTA